MGLNQCAHGEAVFIDIVHNEIHEGDHYMGVHYVFETHTASPTKCRITAPNTAVRIHFTFSAYASAAGTIAVYENPTLDAAGTALTAFNNDRNSANTATATIFYDTTTKVPNNDGTLMWQGRLGGAGNAGIKLSGETGSREEIILDQAEDYMLIFTPDADHTAYSLNFSWYEL